MANYTIFSANSLTQGTDSPDLFFYRTALGSTVQGNGGADQFSAAAGADNFTNAVVLGGGGADTVYLTANDGPIAAVGSFLLGGGADLFRASSLATNTTTIIGGGGADTIDLQGGGDHVDLNLNGNADNDLIRASGVSFTRGLVAGGGGDDTITLNALGASDRVTINGGGGNDSIFLSGNVNLSAIRIDGDTTQESQFFGNDTVTVQGGGLTGSYVQLAGGNDIFIHSAAAGLASGATIEGGDGTDSISLSNIAAGAGVFIGGGAGVDTIVVSGALNANFGTIQGGGGADVITISGAAATGGNIIGGDDGDLIGLGSIANGFSTGGAATDVASGVNVSYENFGQSTIGALDVISAVSDAAASGASFMVTQSAVDFAAVANGARGAGDNLFTVTSGQRVSGGAFAVGTVSLTQRAAALDAGLTAGQSVLFEVGGQAYLFVQGGAAGSGTGNDLVAQLNVGGFVLSGGTGQGGIATTTNASAIKIAFVNAGGGNGF